MTKPLMCPLRLHRWESQTNPETRESYEVCLRCVTRIGIGVEPLLELARLE